MKVGRFEIHEVRDGNFSLDGGTLFGTAPRLAWSTFLKPNELNHVPLVLRCLLVVDGARNILVNNGVGHEGGERLRSDPIARMHCTSDQSDFSLDTELQRLGVSRAEITDVVLTHLHFEHCGGTTRLEDGRRMLSFPNATHHIQLDQWLWARSPSEKDAGTYRREAFDLLERAGRVHLLQGRTELWPGFEVLISNGHTPSLQLPLLQSEGQSLLYCSDLISTTAHLRRNWVMSYALRPACLLEERRTTLARALRERWILAFELDPHVSACTIREEQGEVVPDRLLTL